MKNLETVLIDHGVSSEDVEKAKVYQRRAGGALEKVLLNMGSYSEELLPSIYAQLLGAALLDSKQREAWVPPKQTEVVPYQFSWTMAGCCLEPMMMTYYSCLTNQRVGM